MTKNSQTSKNSEAYRALVRAETEHIRRSIEWKPNWPQRGFLWALTGISVFVFAWRVVNAIPQEGYFLGWLLNLFNVTLDNFNAIYGPGGWNEILWPISLLYPLCVIVWEVWNHIQTLIMATNSIARERQRASWDLLLLSGLTIRQILQANYRAVVGVQWKKYALLAALRIGAVSFLAMMFSVDFTPGRPAYFSYGSQGPATDPERISVYLIVIGIVLLSALLVAILTMLNLLFVAACGILGGVIAPRPGLSLHYGIGIFAVIVAAIALVAGATGYIVEILGYPDAVFNTVSLTLLLTGVTLIGNGTISAGLLMRYGYNFRWIWSFNGFGDFLNHLHASMDTQRANGLAFFASLLVVALVLQSLTFVVLWGARRLASRQQTT